MDGSCDREMLLQWNPDTTILDITRGGFRGGGGGGEGAAAPAFSSSEIYFLSKYTIIL